MIDQVAARVSVELRVGPDGKRSRWGGEQPQDWSRQRRTEMRELRAYEAAKRANVLPPNDECVDAICMLGMFEAGTAAPPALPRVLPELDVFTDRERPYRELALACLLVVPDGFDGREWLIGSNWTMGQLLRCHPGTAPRILGGLAQLGLVQREPYYEQVLVEYELQSVSGEAGVRQRYQCHTRSTCRYRLPHRVRDLVEHALEGLHGGPRPGRRPIRSAMQSGVEAPRKPREFSAVFPVGGDHVHAAPAPTLDGADPADPADRTPTTCPTPDQSGVGGTAAPVIEAQGSTEPDALPSGSGGSGGALVRLRVLDGPPERAVAMLAKQYGVSMGRIHARFYDGYQAARARDARVLQRKVADLEAERARLHDHIARLSREHFAPRPAPPSGDGWVTVGGLVLSAQDAELLERAAHGSRELNLELAERAAAEFALEQAARVAARASATSASPMAPSADVDEELEEIIARQFEQRFGKPDQSMRDALRMVAAAEVPGSSPASAAAHGLLRVIREAKARLRGGDR